MLLEGAPALTAAPATLELPVGLEAEATALPLGCALVEVDCKERGGSHRWGWRGRLTIYPLLAGVIETAPHPWITPMIIIILAGIIDGKLIINGAS